VFVGNVLKIESDEHILQIDPLHGGRIVSWQIESVDVLAPAEDHPIRGGMYVMAPWVGRLKDASVTYNKRQYPQPHNYKQWAIHGSMPFSPCDVSRISDSEVIVHHTTSSTWPVQMNIDVSWKVSSIGLVSSARISTTDGEFPAAIGWHPWFLKTLSNGCSATYSFDSNQQFEVDEECIVTGNLIEKTQGLHDDSFILRSGHVEIFWEGFRTINIETSARYIHLFETERLVCLEPETSPPNGVNFAHEGFSDIIGPSRPLTAYAHFLVEPR